MASASEQSFGARLLRAQTLNNFTANFSNFLPPRSEESNANMQLLLDSVLAANAAESSAKQNYNTAVSLRYDIFRNSTVSIFKLLPNIRAAVEAQYGKNSLSFKQIDTIVKHIRDTKIARVAATESTPESTVSRSEQSYGSTTQYFNNLISNLAQLNGYNPSNTSITVTALQSFANEVAVLNTNVSTTYQTLRAARNARNLLYDDLKDRVSRIKAYTKGNYGTTSQEYTLIKGLSV
jgi:hypothetical protein